MRLREGATGTFLGCTGFPECRATRQLLTEEVEEVYRAENSESWKRLALYWEARFYDERKFWIANAPNVVPGQEIVMRRDAQCPTCGRGLG
jgi:ssDNA-binding Zn-finger/Zn-ribbon topoisomerase 1